MPVSCPVQKPADEAAAQLVAVLVEDAGQLQDAGIAGGVVGRLGAGPGVLVAADHDEVVAAALDLADRDLHGAPAVLDVGAEPHAHGPAFSISRSFRPAVRAMPMQGSVAISVL